MNRRGGDLRGCQPACDEVSHVASLCLAAWCRAGWGRGLCSFPIARSAVLCWELHDVVPLILLCSSAS